MRTEQILCLQYANDLESELGIAMHAISSDSLDALEESLWKQQVLCANLRRQLELLHSGENPLPQDASLHNAIASLQGVNRTYAALVQQSRSSADLLLSFSLGYGAAASELHNQDALVCSFEA